SVDTEEEVESEESDTDTETASDVPEKPEVLTMWVNDEDAQLDAYELITERFTEEYGIPVDITPYSMLEQTDGLSLD
ncbi:hypothetical protein, partial [Pseudomonas sp. 2822-17]|uniref:hypothetical protein n=1 Tax=Pseudomonas sp. 2822-17 TaxID=1712678 RepID=UPI001C47F6BA